MNLRLPHQMKYMGYCGLIRPAAQFAVIQIGTLVIAGLMLAYICCQCRPAARAEGENDFYLLLVLGLVLGGVSVGRALYSYWVNQAIRLLKKHD
jgi:hypothetical protein